MIDFSYYIVKVSSVFAVLYLFYRISFSRLTFHNANRALMLVMLPLSLIIPFIDMGISSHSIFQNTSIPVLFDDFGDVNNNTQQAQVINSSALSYGKIIVMLYALGVLAYLIKMLQNLIKIIRIKSQSESYVSGGFRILIADVPMAFSCFKWIFLPKNKEGEIHSSIVEHEKLHCRTWHTLDLGFTELFVALLWFNPFVYLFRRDLKTVHEYQVDSMILQFSMKKSDYLQILLNNLVSSHKLVSLCNYFNGLTIKKRVKMITKESSPKWKLISYLLVIPIISIMTMSFSGSANIDGGVPDISPIKSSNYEKVSLTFGKINPRKQIHKGIDFKANAGTEIVATADGVVTTAEFHNKGYGNRVIINHGDSFVTLYAHMEKFTVKTGDRVKRGDVIGFVGSTGYSTGPHLHYEVRKNGKPVNPQDYIKD